MRASRARLLAVGLALLAGAARAGAPAAVDPAPVVAAERAFAADGLKLGVRQSFLRHAAPDGIIFGPDPYSAVKAYRDAPDDRNGPPLVWWPLWAGIARSGDLGFTTGPFSYGGKAAGYYFTVWKRQADGTWKWLYDGGPPSSPAGAAPQGSPPAYLPVSTVRGRYPEAAFAEVKAMEAALSAAARVDVKTAYMKVLAPDGRVAGSRAAPLNTVEGQARELATRPTKIVFSPLGGEASAAGDLAWTYGDARWAVPPPATYGDPPQSDRGHYVRIWQRRAAGWRLVYDMILAVPPPRPPE